VDLEEEEEEAGSLSAMKRKGGVYNNTKTHCREEVNEVPQCKGAELTTSIAEFGN